MLTAPYVTSYLTEHFGNASSLSHPFGLQAAEAVDKARRQVCDLIGANPNEIVFTSGATESDNAAIKGAAWAEGRTGGHIITTSIEHRAVLETCQFLETRGFKVTWLPVDENAMIDPADVKKAITPETFLISVMHANSEVGTIQPVAEVGEIGVVFYIGVEGIKVKSVQLIPSGQGNMAAIGIQQHNKEAMVSNKFTDSAAQ